MTKEYTKKDLLDYLRHFRYEINRSPSMEDFADHPECPNPTTYQNRFDSWNEAKREAGVGILQHGRVEDDELIDDLRQADDMIEGNLSAPEYSEVGKFGINIYCERFGSWNDAKEKAGISTSKFGSKYSDEYLLDHLIDLRSELGHMPAEPEINEDDGPSANTYRNHFGSVVTAKNEAKKLLEG